MNRTVNIEELEAALIARANTLAEEYLAHAHRNREQINSDANKRLNLREEREILTAKAAAERMFRQRVQAAEIKQQEELDRLRWGLIQKVMQELSTRFTQVAADEKVYLPLLQRYLARAAMAIDDYELVAEINAQDHARVAKKWDAFCGEAQVHKHVVLAPDPLLCLGGVRVRNSGNTIRMDNTFEARMERLQDELLQTVMERLFAAAATARGAMRGG